MGRISRSIFLAGIFMVLFSVIIFAEYKQQKLKEKITDKYMHSESKDKNVVLNWVDSDKITTEDAFKDIEYLKNIEQTKGKIDKNKKFNKAGYLVYIFKKEKEDNYFKGMQIMRGFSQQVLFTDKQCLNVPNLNVNTEYYVFIKYIFQNEELKLGFKQVGNDSNIEPENCFVFTTPRNYSYSATPSDCNAPNIKTTLKELNDNKEKYNGKFIEIEGNLNEDNGIMKQDKINFINNMIKKNDGAIFDGNFGLFVSGLSMSTKRNFIKNRHKNRIKFIGYFHQTNINSSINTYKCDLIAGLD